jgi:protein-S-isoprenylcysteine O-methyltransferase Ste14
MALAARILQPSLRSDASMNTERNSGESGVRPQGQGEFWVFGQVVLLTAIILAPLVLSSRSIVPDCIAGLAIVFGLVLVLVGCALSALSAVALGSSFSILPHPKADGLFVQHSIYEKLRHPMYSGVVLIALGWSLFWVNLPGVLLTLALGYLFERKARREEVWLDEKYPEYASYRQKVPRRFPWSYSRHPVEQSPAVPFE